MSYQHGNTEPFRFQVLCCKSPQQLTTRFCSLPEGDIESNTDFAVATIVTTLNPIYVARQRPSSGRCPPVTNTAWEPCTMHGSAFLLEQILHDQQRPAEDENGTIAAVSLFVYKHPKGPTTMPLQAYPKKWDRIGPCMRPRSSAAVFTVMGRPCGIGSSCPAVVICSRPGSGDDLGRLVWVMGTSGLDFGSGKIGGSGSKDPFKEW